MCLCFDFRDISYVFQQICPCYRQQRALCSQQHGRYCSIASVSNTFDIIRHIAGKERKHQETCTRENWKNWKINMFYQYLHAFLHVVNTILHFTSLFLLHSLPDRRLRKDRFNGFSSCLRNNNTKEKIIFISFMKTARQ